MSRGWKFFFLLLHPAIERNLCARHQGRNVVDRALAHQRCQANAGVAQIRARGRRNITAIQALGPDVVAGADEHGALGEAIRIDIVGLGELVPSLFEVALVERNLVERADRLDLFGFAQLHA
jgi:hypothetical protein